MIVTDNTIPRAQQTGADATEKTLVLKIDNVDSLRATSTESPSKQTTRALPATLHEQHFWRYRNTSGKATIHLTTGNSIPLTSTPSPSSPSRQNHRPPSPSQHASACQRPSSLELPTAPPRRLSCISTKSFIIKLWQKYKPLASSSASMISCSSRYLLPIFSQSNSSCFIMMYWLGVRPGTSSA